MLTVKLFARARQVAGAPQLELPWSDGETVQKLKQQLSVAQPNLAPLIPGLLVAVNNEYAQDATTIQSTDEVACFPPVSGG